MISEPFRPARVGEPPVMIQRLRVRLCRHGDAARYSHLQQIDLMRKSFALAKWPLMMSQSKKPVPKISFGPAISVGYESEAEYVDVALTARLNLQEGAISLKAALPMGYGVMEIKSIPRFFPSLEEAVNVAEYRLESPHLEGTEDRWREFWESPVFIVVKKKGECDVAVDARACVIRYELTGSSLNVLIRFGPGKTLKPERIAQVVCGWPDEVIRLGTGSDKVKVIRKNLFFEKSAGGLVQP